MSKKSTRRRRSMAAAFTEWLERYHRGEGFWLDTPKRGARKTQRVAYGKDCAKYLQALMRGSL